MLPLGSGKTGVMGFAELFSVRREAAEKGIRTWVERIGEEAPPALVQAMSYSLLGPGKRLRPVMVMLACEATGGHIEAAIPSAVAVEMIHAYSLIHDDLPAMDDDDLRRGLPTSHKKFGEAMAILAGDALLTGAFAVLSRGYPAKTAAVSCLELASGAGAGGMVGGQVLDLAAEGRISDVKKPQNSEDLEAIHLRKTGGLFRSSLRLGLYAAQAERVEGVDPLALQSLDRFGRAFGLAFQISDDLLDVEGNSEQTGKRVGKDAARGKLTFPGLLGVEESRRQAQRLYEEAAQALESLGAPAKPLVDLARFVMERDR
jgi:geranylgeranyl diphosphate synthase type II